MLDCLKPPVRQSLVNRYLGSVPWIALPIPRSHGWPPNLRLLYFQRMAMGLSRSVALPLLQNRFPAWASNQLGLLAQ